ncbi:MAG: hypothetical protein JRE10_15170 [Deltaproteobacteria bacterium]|nr:hypothetical protein [Deltaproteobacteria bacterium]
MPPVIFFACLELERKSSLINRLMLWSLKNERNPMIPASIFRIFNACRAISAAAAAAAGQPVVLKGSG